MNEGTFHPRRNQVHQPVGGHLAAGSALANATLVSERVNCAGAARVRFRLKASVGGAVAIYGFRPSQNSTSKYDTAIATATLVANTELVIDIAEHFGEHALSLELTPSSGPGTVTHCDVMMT